MMKPLIMVLLGLMLNIAQGQYVQKSRFATEKQRRAHYQLDDWISYGQITQLNNMAMGTRMVYIATNGGGILRFNMDKHLWEYPYSTSNGLPSNTVTRVEYDRKTHKLWAFTPNDVAVFDEGASEWIRKSETDFWNERLTETIPKTKTDRGVFYTGVFKGIASFFANGDYTILAEGKLMDSQFREYDLSGYLIDRYGNLWTLIDGFGIGKGELATSRLDFFHVGLAAISPRAIAYQNENLWIGGINKNQRDSGIQLWTYPQENWLRYTAQYNSYLPSDNVFDIVVRNDSIWFATDEGVSLFDTGNDKWKNFSLREGLSSNLVNDLRIFESYLYVATDRGISRIHLASGVVEQDKTPALNFRQINKFDSDKKSIWAATGLGVYRLKSGSKKWEWISSKAAITDLRISAVDVYKNEVWFASPGGIMVLDTKTEEWQSFPQISFEVATPYADIKTSKSAVWVATKDGLLKYDKIQKYWRLFTTTDGLPKNNCHQILLDGSNLWVVTDAGITQFYWKSKQRSF